MSITEEGARRRNASYSDGLIHIYIMVDAMCRSISIELIILMLICNNKLIKIERR